MSVFVEPGFDERIEARDLLIEGLQALGDAGDHGGREGLSRQCGALGSGRLDGCLGERGGVLHLAVLQPGSDTSGPASADRSRRLVAGQQHDGTFLAEVQGPLQRGEELQQLGPQSVGLTGAVVDQAEAAGGQGAQVDGYLVAGPQETEVLAHARLVSDDERVLLVRLALTAVGRRRLVHGQAGDGDHRLPVAEQEADEQGGAIVVDVHRPQGVLGEREYVCDQLQQGRFLVEDPA